MENPNGNELTILKHIESGSTDLASSVINHTVNDLFDVAQQSKIPLPLVVGSIFVGVFSALKSEYYSKKND